MAHWDVWPELLALRDRHKELAPIFAKIGISGDISSFASNIRAMLQKRPPTKPLTTGDEDHDSKLMEGYRKQLKDQFEECFYKTEQLLRMPWPPEMEPIANLIRDEVARLRALREQDADTVFDVAEMDRLIALYVEPYQAGGLIDQEALAERKELLIQLIGFPLIAARHINAPELDLLPPYNTREYRELFEQNLMGYYEQSWVHNSHTGTAFVRLSIEMALSKMAHHTYDHNWLNQRLKFVWPSPGVLIPGEHVDTIWYILLSLLCVATLYLEWWWAGLGLVLWLKLSVTMTRRHREKIKELQQKMEQRCLRLRKARDQVAGGRFDVKLMLRFLKQPEYHHYIPRACLSLLELAAEA